MECGLESGEDVVRIEGDGVRDGAEMREWTDVHLGEYSPRLKLKKCTGGLIW